MSHYIFNILGVSRIIHARAINHDCFNAAFRDGFSTVRDRIETAQEMGLLTPEFIIDRMFFIPDLLEAVAHEIIYHIPPWHEEFSTYSVMDQLLDDGAGEFMITVFNSFQEGRLGYSEMIGLFDNLIQEQPIYVPHGFECHC